MFTMTVKLRIAPCEIGTDVLAEVLNDVPEVACFNGPCPSSATVVRPDGDTARPWWDDVPAVEVTFDTEDEARIWWSQLMGFAKRKKG